MKENRYRILLALPLLALTLLAGSCIKESDSYPDLPTRTVLVYLSGDNNLGDIGRTPELLKLGWKYTGSRCLIYYDAPDAAPQLLELTSGCSDPTPYLVTVAEYPEENSASAAVFSRMVREVVVRYPADSYGLIFASHASGWLPAGTLTNPTRSIGSDQNTGAMGGASEMELADFAAAIPDQQFDFILFEACLMSGVEVAYELRDKTDYILASSAEVLAPGYGLLYPWASTDLFDTRLEVRQALEKFAGNYMNHVNTLGGAYRSATQSVICTKEMNTLAALTREVFEGAEAPLGDDALAALQHFDRPGSYGDSPAKPRYFDFAQYLAMLAPERQTEVEALLNRIVVWKAATQKFLEGQNGFTIRTHCGLTIYIEQSAFPKLNTSYQRTAWWQATQQPV